MDRYWVGRMRVVLFLVAVVSSADASAFGTNDLLSIGLRLGGKVVGAVVDAGVDKVRDALRDPEAEAAKQREEERRLVAQFQKQVAEIEAQPNLRPIDRERLILTLERLYTQSAQFQAFVQVAEARQREERDKIFSSAGLLDVVGEAVLATPSVTMARAEARARTGEIQTQEAMARMQVEAGGDSRAGQTMVGAAVIGIRAEQMRDQVAKGIEEGRAAALTSHGDEVAAAVAEARVKAETSTLPGQPRLDAFSPDVERRMFVEFIGSPSETANLRRTLEERGHRMVDRGEDAEVVYRIEGEYTLGATKTKGELTVDVGSLLETPAQPLVQPEKKRSLSSRLGRFLFGMGAVQMPDNATGEGIPRQSLLLVAARIPVEGKETRTSIHRVDLSGSLTGAALSVVARDELYERLGLAP